MNKISLAILSLIILVFSGCGTTLKQQWYDFTAYYNTFYNANQYFDAGLQKNRNLRSDINPNELIRIHPPPTAAGAEDFERSIEKSADILRRHSQSKYVDDAIELIGASFFYRQEYFAALEKFQELYSTTNDNDMRQNATLWEGRTYLELEFYSEGARFMESRIEGIDDWKPNKLSEARAILAQLYAFQNNLHQAGNQLLLALENLEGRDLRPRAYFHYGQIMERMENLQQAGYAFREIRNMRPAFDLEYNARLREVDLLRRTGELDEASNQLRSMERNNKFFEFRLELLYELAKTERMRGNSSQAESIYKRVIHSDTMVPEPPLIARSYYGLAELYRFDFHSFETAAAYYDSASSSASDLNLLPSGWDADYLAQAFGEYASVKQEAVHLDSLLKLGMLPEEEFDARIEEIQRQRRAEIEEQRIAQERTDSRLIDLEMEEVIEATTEVGVHGFLNVNNRTMLQQSSLRFRAIWGDRPLADDWRRREAVTGRRQNFDNQRAVVQPEILEADMEADDIFELQLDLGEIPFEEHQQDSVRVLIYRKYYQLGNVFSMSLSMPDSAKFYFEKVINEGPEGSPIASAIYALSDIYLQDEQQEEAIYWAGELISRYPDTELARRISARTGLPIIETEEESDFPETVMSLDIFPALSAVDLKAAEWKQKARNESNREEAARFLFEAASEYIRSAREDEFYEVKQQKWQIVERHSQEFPALDSLLRGNADTLSVGNELLSALGLEDTRMLTQDKLREIYPYEGEYWDMAREILLELQNSYPGTSAASRAALLLGELNRLPFIARNPEYSIEDMD